MNESVVATIGSNVLVLDTPEEREMDRETSLIEQRADHMLVEDDLGYASAGAMLKQIKGVQKKVKEYWEPLRVSAKKAYDEVLAKKKQMMDPLDHAESTLKRKMADFTLEQERKAREREEQRLQDIKDAIDQKIGEAAEMEANGDSVGADFAMAEAEVYDQYAASSTVEATQPKVDGLSMHKTWKIKAIDASKVPVYFNGVELRPVDTAAVLRLVKSSKGQIIIPGIEIEEDIVMSARA